TQEAREKLKRHLGDSWNDELGNHLAGIGNGIGFFEDIGNDRVRDYFGVIWDRSQDKDIGNVEGTVLAEPSDLAGYAFPDPHGEVVFGGCDKALEDCGDAYRIFSLGFSLFERAWTLRGMESLLMDMVTEPTFVHDLLTRIADYNIAQVTRAIELDIDAVYFGDDWGQQHGLIMGPELWRSFILPQVKRMYGAVREAGKAVFIHSCGDVDELFPELIDAGLNCFNPFQPEVMDVHSLLEAYRGRLAFHGGLSTQQTLPFGSVEEVREESERLLGAGREGGYIFAPAHAVEGDVPLENMLAFIEAAREQAHAAALS
ncbi:MAG: uroporphyrinogen decarboxylase family protein, partial [Planctomycetota bacterium]